MHIETKCHQILQESLAEIAEEQLLKPLPQVDVEIVEDASFNAYIQRVFGKFTICLNTGLLQELEVSLSNLLPQTDIVLSYALDFIIRHEMGHLVSGHMQAEEEQFNEVCRGEKSKEHLWIRYLQEFEADAFAIENMMVHHIEQESEETRQPSYFLFLLAVWATISLFELNQSREKRYPYPISRIIAALNTTIAGFASFEVDILEGSRTVTLDDEQASKANLFFTEIASVVAKKLADFPTNDKAIELYSFAGEYGVGSVFAVIGDLLFDTNNSSSGALKEIRDIERLRIRRTKR